MTFTPPYTNTFRSILLDFTSGTGTTTGTINVPFDVDEVIFRGLLATFPSFTYPAGVAPGTQYELYFCDPLTNGAGAPIGFSHYTSIVDTYQSSSTSFISYMYPTPRYFQGQYTFSQVNPLIIGQNSSFTQSVTILVEFRKYN